MPHFLPHILNEDKKRNVWYTQITVNTFICMFFKRLKPAHIALLASIALFIFGANTAHAADPKHTIKDPAYAVKYMGQSIPDPVEIEAGTSKTVIFKFKNTGTATWDSGSKRFLSGYTVGPRYRSSLFKGLNWIEAKETGKIEGVIKPGQTGELKLDLTAPDKPGSYLEEFYLAADNHTWVKGGYFYVKIKVVAKKQAVAGQKEVAAPIEASTSNTNSAHQAKRLILSKTVVDVAGGGDIPVIIAFQNIGNTTWSSYALKTSVISTVAAASAGSQTTLVEKSASLSAGSIAREEVVIKAPKEKGNYTIAVKLAANGVDIGEELGTISVNVTENAATIESGVLSQQPAASEALPRLGTEPRIRVGVWKDPQNGVKFRSDDDDYYIFDGGTLMGTLARGVEAAMTYSGGTYNFSAGDIAFASTAFVRLEPINNPHSVFRLPNYERLVSWKGPRNFNTYRGAMEYRATKSGEGVYMINDLLFEDYVAGIAETSNASSMEYIKALLTAARTYAYYIQNSSSKHDTRFFDVVATTGDQLYLGYESEVLMPRVAEAARATRGYMITYNTDQNPDTQSDIVITPYYGNSDGRTRAWTEVWGGSAKPWLVSVIAEFDKRDGKSMYGHGVGMSARDAAYRSEDLGESWTQIIKYYYTGVEVEKIFN